MLFWISLLVWQNLYPYLCHYCMVASQMINFPGMNYQSQNQYLWYVCLPLSIYQPFLCNLLYLFMHRDKKWHKYKQLNVTDYMTVRYSQITVKLTATWHKNAHQLLKSVSIVKYCIKSRLVGQY